MSFWDKIRGKKKPEPKMLLVDGDEVIDEATIINQEPLNLKKRALGGFEGTNDAVTNYKKKRKKKNG